MDQTQSKSPTMPVGSRGHLLKIYLFTGTLFVFFVIGLLFFIRPSVSEEEKRTLTPFPSFTWESFLSGEYFSAISTWYADTFPMRDDFISLNQSVKGLYGIRKNQIIQNTPSAPSEGNQNTPGNETGEKVERFDKVYIKGNRAFEIYSFSETASKRYASVISSAAAKMPNVKVYSLIAPLSYSVNLTEREQQEIGASNVEDAIRFMYSNMSADVTTVEVFSDLLAHKNEELYFRTDHHWTARGAYYAYAAFCRSSGQEPLPLDGWQKLTFNGFLGTLYSASGKHQALANDPDTVEAWLPNSTNEMRTFTADKKWVTEYPIIRKNPNYYQAAGSKYNCFIAGDHPLIEIVNPTPERTNGKTLILVKESYGNALAPFLVDQYAKVYVVDYRYFRAATGKTLPELAAEVNANEVLFLNYVYATAQSSRLSDLEKLINGG